jgi:D-alanyl-D-alanine carboxypeptidase
MEITAAKQYRSMYDAARVDGAKLVPYSGYRSINRQKGNFDRQISSYINKGYSRAEAVNLAAMSILPPGCSEHNSGLAMDIWDIREDFDTTKILFSILPKAQECDRIRI